MKRQQVLLVKPLTFVNLSGHSARSIVRRNKIQLEDLLVVCDDVNLPLGKIRIRPSGSDGGHKGLRSIIEALQSESFPRLRIGVGAPIRAEEDTLKEHVLGNFDKKEIKVIGEAIETAAACCSVWAEEGIAAAMNRFNRKGD